MTATLLIEQVLNGLQFGVMLFLMAAGLTLVFGVMGLINLAHGSLYMVGAFACAAVAAATGSFLLGLAAALAAAAAAGAIVEVVVLRRLYDRDHLDQVLATFALILSSPRARAGSSAPSRSISTSPTRSPARSRSPAASATRPTGSRSSSSASLVARRPLPR